MPRRRNLVLLLFFLVLTVGCGETKSDSPLTTLRISAGPHLATSPLYLGVERGYFEEAGLRIEIVPLANSSQAIPLLATGQLDVIFGGFTPSLGNAVLKDVNVRIVAGREVYSPGCTISGTLYASRKSFPNGLKGVQDLRGKRVSTSRRGGMGEFILTELLKSGNMTEEDITVVQLRQSDAIGALLGGKIDAALAGIPHHSPALASDKVFAALRLADLMPDFQYSYIMFGGTLLDEPDLDLGCRFLAAYRQACGGFLDGETPQFMIDFATRNNLDVDSVVNACRGTFREDCAVQLEDLDRQIDFYRGLGYIEAPLTAEQVADLRFLRRLDKDRRHTDE